MHLRLIFARGVFMPAVFAFASIAFADAFAEAPSATLSRSSVEAKGRGEAVLTV